MELLQICSWHLGMSTKFSWEAVVWRCSVKKVFLEISQNSQENTCARVSFLIKLQASCGWFFHFWAKFSWEEVVWRCSVNKVFLEISQNSQENSCARVSSCRPPVAASSISDQPSQSWVPPSPFLNLNISQICFWKLFLTFKNFTKCTGKHLRHLCLFFNKKNPEDIWNQFLTITNTLSLHYLV